MRILSTCASAWRLLSLRRRVRNLERRMREVERVYSLGIVAGGVVHELRNPMSVLVGYLELARAQVASADMARVIEGAWDAARAHGGHHQGGRADHPPLIGRQHGDIAEVADLTIKLVLNELRHRATAMIDLAPPLPVAISATRLGQVVLNLVIKAIGRCCWLGSVGVC